MPVADEKQKNPDKPGVCLSRRSVLAGSLYWQVASISRWDLTILEKSWIWVCDLIPTWWTRFLPILTFFCLTTSIHISSHAYKLNIDTANLDRINWSNGRHFPLSFSSYFFIHKAGSIEVHYISEFNPSYCIILSSVVVYLGSGFFLSSG